MDRRSNFIFAGRLLFLSGALAATFVAMHRHREPGAAIGASLSPPPVRQCAPVTQLPKIVARSEQGGLRVVLRNDTEDRQVFLDPVWDKLVVEYSRASGNRTEYRVAVPDRTLGPGEETEAVFVPLDERAGPAKVEFVYTEHVANSKLVARTHVTVP